MIEEYILCDNCGEPMSSSVNEETNETIWSCECGYEFTEGDYD